MFRSTRRLVLPLVLVCAAPAAAKPVAVGSSPAVNAAVAKPNRVEIRLSEKVVAEGASIELAMTAMPGMADHGVMKIAGFKTVVAADGKTLVAQLPRPLPLGTYSVKWAAGAGADRGEGSFSFRVK